MTKCAYRWWIPALMVALLLVVSGPRAMAQEPATLEDPPPTATELVTDAAESATESTAVAETESTPVELATPDEQALVAEEPAPVETTDEALETAAEEGATEADVTEEGVTETEPATADEAIDWGGLVERAPAFFSVLHPVVVHFPIALWILGAFFVLVGLVFPSWGRQVPIVCLLAGTLGAVASTLTGWWVADEGGWEGWREFDWESGFCQHRWIGVALVGASVILSFMAIHSVWNDRPRSFLWRVGLIALALAVGYEGHLGGELVHSTTIEEAFEAWVNP